jgi:hypothetical protein
MKIIDYSPVNDLIFLTTINGKIEIYQDEHLLIYNSAEGRKINSASFSHDAQHVIFVDQDEKRLNIMAYDDLLHNNFNYIFNFKTDYIIEDYAVSPNKNRIAILFRVRHHITHFISEQRFMPDANLNNLLLHVYDFTPDNCLLIFRKYVNGIANIALSELDNIAIIGEFNVDGQDCALNIFDLNNGRLIDSGYEIGTVLFVHFYPESQDNHNKLLLIIQDADARANENYKIETRTIGNLHLTQTLIIEFVINSIYIKKNGEITFAANDGIRFFKIDGRIYPYHLFQGNNIGQISYSQTENCIAFGKIDDDQSYKSVIVLNISLNRITFKDEIDSSQEDGDDDDHDDEYEEDEDEESEYEDYEDYEDDEEDEIFINPADINKCIAPPTNPQKLQIYGNTNCFDTIQLNEENIGQYLSADLDNIVIFYKQVEDADFLATCLSFTGLRKYLQDPKYGFYTCVEDTDIRTYIDDEPDFLKIPTQTQTIFVSYQDIKQKYIERQNMIFLEYSERVKNTITYDAIITNNFVSSNHCQDGSIIDVYRIIF